MKHAVSLVFLALGVFPLLDAPEVASAVEPDVVPIEAVPASSADLANLEVHATTKWRWDTSFGETPTRPTLSVNMKLQGILATEASSIGHFELESIADENGRPLKSRWSSFWSYQMCPIFRPYRNEASDPLPKDIQDSMNRVQLSVWIKDLQPIRSLSEFRGSIVLETGGHHQTVVVKDILKYSGQAIENDVLKTLGVIVTATQETPKRPDVTAAGGSAGRQPSPPIPSDVTRKDTAGSDPAPRISCDAEENCRPDVPPVDPHRLSGPVIVKALWRALMATPELTFGPQWDANAAHLEGVEFPAVPDSDESPNVIGGSSPTAIAPGPVDKVVIEGRWGCDKIMSFLLVDAHGNLLNSSQGFTLDSDSKKIRATINVFDEPIPADAQLRVTIHRDARLIRVPLTLKNIAVGPAPQNPDSSPTSIAPTTYVAPQFQPQQAR